MLNACDKPYHKIKENMPLGEELENLWNYPSSDIDDHKESLSLLVVLTPDLSKHNRHCLKRTSNSGPPA